MIRFATPSLFFYINQNCLTSICRTIDLDNLIVQLECHVLFLRRQAMLLRVTIAVDPAAETQGAPSFVRSQQGSAGSTAPIVLQ